MVLKLIRTGDTVEAWQEGTKVLMGRVRKEPAGYIVVGENLIFPDEISALCHIRDHADPKLRDPSVNRVGQAFTGVVRYGSYSVHGCIFSGKVIEQYNDEFVLSVPGYDGGCRAFTLGFSGILSGEFDENG